MSEVKRKESEVNSSEFHGSGNCAQSQDKDSHGASDNPSASNVIDFSFGNPSRTYGILKKLTDLKSSKLVAMLDLPPSLSIKDIFDMLMETLNLVYRMRIVRHPKKDYFVIVFKFHTDKDAEVFVKGFNTKSLLLFEDCHKCEMAFVEISCFNDSSTNFFPNIENEPCTICLEQLTDGGHSVITILCNHSFHTDCFSRVEDLRCPICRFVQTTPFSLTARSNSCDVCNCFEDLWMCVICGSISCGRLKQNHAFQHFFQTGHLYGMELASDKRLVWDYADDKFAYRLLANTEDGKVVASGTIDKISSGMLDYSPEAVSYFSYIYNTQVEFYETKLASLSTDFQFKTDELTKKLTSVENCLQECASKEKTLGAVISDYKEKINKIRNEHKSLTANYSAVKVSLQSLSKENEEIASKLETINKEKLEIAAQIKDLQFFKVAQTKLNETSGLTKDELEKSSTVIKNDLTTNKRRQRRRAQKQ